VATGGSGDGDQEWAARVAAHRRRRPSWWETEEIAADPGRLLALLAEAKPDEALLVDDLGGWLTATLDAGGWDAPPAAGRAEEDDLRGETAIAGPDAPPSLADALAAAVRDCPAAHLVLVSPEVGLSIVPASAAGRTFADRIGEVNRALADACDTVALVVAGQPTWLKGTDPRGPAPQETTPEPTITSTTWADAVTVALPTVALNATPERASAATVDADRIGDTPIAVNMPLPMPDETAAADAGTRLADIEFAGTGLGALVPVVRFAAGTQGQPVPRPWQSVRTFLLHGDHDGGVAAGDSPYASANRLEAAERGEGAWALLAGAAGAAIHTVRCPGAGAAIEYADALRESDVDAALAYGWKLARTRSTRVPT